MLQSSQTPRRSKRPRSASPVPLSSPARPTPQRRDSQSSLPPSSPPAPFSDTDDSLDDRDAVRDAEDQEEDDGEDLFGENLEVYVSSYHPLIPSLMMVLECRDYAPNELLDRYSDAGLDDDEEVAELSAADRRAAELKMARRDKLERAGKRGTRAAHRSRAPAFLGSDDMDDDGDVDDELGLSRFKTRTRRQYDERRDRDDLEGVEDVSAVFTLTWLR